MRAYVLTFLEEDLKGDCVVVRWSKKEEGLEDFKTLTLEMGREGRWKSVGEQVADMAVAMLQSP